MIRILTSNISHTYFYGCPKYNQRITSGATLNKVACYENANQKFRRKKSTKIIQQTRLTSIVL